MGAWIETARKIRARIDCRVAPYVGAWIETLTPSLFASSAWSHPMWVRGLKPAMLNVEQGGEPSHPMWVRGLKRMSFSSTLMYHVAPYVGAWIETIVSGATGLASKSHPMWVRGLKLRAAGYLSERDGVAPYVGAWIETNDYVGTRTVTLSRTLCGCVD